MVRSVDVASGVVVVFTFLLYPLLLAGVASLGMGKFDTWGKDRMTTFFAARPVTSLEYVLIKFKAVALAALASWSISLFFLAIWVALDISPFNHHDSLVRTAWNNATPRIIAGAALCVVGLLLLMWRSMACGLWITLAGRKWLGVIITLSIGPLVLFGIGSSTWNARHPELGRQILAFVPLILVSLVSVKLGVAAVIGFNLKRLGLVSDRQLAIAFAAWAVTAGVILLAINAFLPLTAVIAALVVLIVPLARIAAAPLALYFNRHR
jgi:hypothetical protein